MVINEILISTEPEFEICKKSHLPASYFVMCKKGVNEIGGVDVYKHLIAGERICDWVARACDNAQIIEIYDYQDELNAVLPFLTDSEYTVILNANIPLLNKQHLKDILNFVMLKNMNACKLKGGYIFKTEYLQEVGEILSVNIYNLPTNDFFEVTNFETLNFAKKEIEKRMFNYFSKNGVVFEDDSCILDANVQISLGSQVKAGSKILSASRLSNEVFVGQNCLISNSRIDDAVRLADNITIKNSQIAASSQIGDNVYIENSTIGDDCVIESGSKVINSQIGVGVRVKPLCDIFGSNIKRGAVIGTMARLFNAEIEEDYEVYDGKVIIHRVEDKK